MNTVEYTFRDPKHLDLNQGAVLVDLLRGLYSNVMDHQQPTPGQGCSECHIRVHTFAVVDGWLKFIKVCVRVRVHAYVRVCVCRDIIYLFKIPQYSLSPGKHH